MNKSLALKNKIYILFLFLMSFFLFVYLLYFLINGERGLISYYKIKKLNISYEVKLSNLNKKNKNLINKIDRLKTNTIDLDYLDEKLRENTGFIDKNEILISFDQ
jgi:cell division protein FtsB